MVETCINSSTRKSSCPLCRGKKLSEWFWNDEVCWVAECTHCHQPMIVLNHHGEPTEKELQHMKIVSKKLFPDKGWRGVRRQIQGHFHEHLI